jgi:hypothetical protein
MAKQVFSVPSQTYQPGLTNFTSNLPPGQNYTAVEVSIDMSPWISTSTTLVRFGISYSIDHGQTYTEITHTDEIVPPPWTIPAKYGGGTISTVTLDASEPFSPDHGMLWVYIEGAAVSLGTLSGTLS